ncbi:hypothetical protein [Ktedonospora formicarum]|uniref:Uncharacterized protein n=1 Tax=Ktedonospora formicarum TaxID=2778364 RepID=A0A8J3HVZ3_9CHLR|nr:hypothetical protein [Ktedonospora formicarum]GHO45092.1 hypothetical protein KSX_32550 [Ktedonospora formicarum]
MRKWQAWNYLIVVFALFWLSFAIFLIFVSGFPFLVISIALTTIGAFSAIITALAWAYENNK